MEKEILRPDLDGLSITSGIDCAIYLIIHGKRRAISESLQSKIMKPSAIPTVMEKLDKVTCGPNLHDDSCLVRAGCDPGIFFFVATEDSVRLHLIANWQTFCDYNFREDAVISIPPRFFCNIPSGMYITSAASRLSSER